MFTSLLCPCIIFMNEQGVLGIIGTLQWLAKHPRWPMSGVTLSPVSNTKPNKPSLGCLAAASLECPCALFLAGFWELKAWVLSRQSCVSKAPYRAWQQDCLDSIMLVVYQLVPLLYPLRRRLVRHGKFLYGLYMASCDNLKIAVLKRIRKYRPIPIIFCWDLSANTELPPLYNWLKIFKCRINVNFTLIQRLWDKLYTNILGVQCIMIVLRQLLLLISPRTNELNM